MGSLINLMDHAKNQEVKNRRQIEELDLALRTNDGFEMRYEQTV